MLKNYFTIAINNLIKNKLCSAINIIGLAIGLAACIVISFYVKDQFSYDTQWQNAGRIYRVNWFGGHSPGKTSYKYALTPLPAMPQLQEYFNDKIEKSARTYSNNMVIDTGTAQFKDNLVMVDPSFIEIFKIEEISGSLKNTLTNPSSLALSAEAAKKYFGSEDPIGKEITVKISGISISYKVTAVYRINGNTILDIPLMGLLQEDKIPPSQKSWHSLRTAAYFLLKEHIDIESLNALTPVFIDKYIESSDLPSIEFQKLEEAHLNSKWDTFRADGNKTVVISFAGISLLVLLIGCINFTILTTANATQRAREVAMRKVVGAKRKQLIVQFLGESILVVLMAMILSLGLVEMLLPLFESIVGITFSLDYTSPSTIFPLLALLLILGISGGLYPAFILSGFRPGVALKANHSKETHGSIFLRNALVICQFSISIILIIVACVIYAQLQYSLNRDHGYNKDNLLTINQLQQHLFPEIRDKLEPLKQELLKLLNVSDVGFSNLQPSHQLSNSYVFTRADQPEITYVIPWNKVDYDFFKTYQIPFIAGRNYSPGRDIPSPVFDFWTGSMVSKTGDSFDKNIIINERAVKELGYANSEEAIGEIISYATGIKVRYTIIGVVADNHMYSINAPPRAEVYILDPVQINTISVRFNGSPKRILEQVESVWKKVIGDMEIHTAFVNQLVAQEFQHEQTQDKILICFSLLAVVIACMGLFGTASFTVERRTMEIGLRKVMGAKVKNIVRLLIWQFSKPILIANIIAWPVAILAMQYWLDRFQYRFNPLYMIPICLASGLIAFVIAWCTVAGNTTRVA
ncbi:MAG: ABC transporter permease, partial [Desulfobacteraceae bacterium]